MLTMLHNGVEKSFADWGIALGSAVCERGNMAPDVYRFSIPIQDAATAPTFAFLSKITVYRERTAVGAGGYVAFVGFRMDPTHDMQPSAEYHHFTFGNAWFLLEQTPFQQPTATWVAAAVGFQFQTSLLMFTKISEGHDVDPEEVIGQLPGFVIEINNGRQIKEVLQHALEQYAVQYPGSDLEVPFQIGTIDPALNLPADPAQELSCAAAIQHSLLLAPDCSVIFDYSTTPPTISVRARANLTPVDTAIRDGTNHKSLNITPMPTLQPTVVIVYFRIIVTENGEARVTYARQKYGPNGANSVADPDGGAFVLIQTMDLSGPTYASQAITVRPVVAANTSTDPTRANVRVWWGNIKPELRSLTIRNTSFADLAVKDENLAAVSLTSYPSEFLDGGNIQPWMKLTDGTPVNAKRVSITQSMLHDLYKQEGTDEDDTDGNQDAKRKDMKLSWSGTITNAVTGYYSALIDSGEDIPGGLAQALWESLVLLQYQGEHITVAAEISAGIKMSNTLNLTNGLVAWATMKAQIQRITEMEGTGQVTISIGPAKHLNSGDLAALRRYNRGRNPVTNVASRENAQP